MSTESSGSDAPPACCAPRRGGCAASGRAPAAVAPGPQRVRPHGGWCEVPEGAFLMGSDEGPYPEDGEGPVREVVLSAFSIAATAVTNDEFAAFADATGYSTDAERFGWTFVFAGFLPRRLAAGPAVAAAPWWRQVHGADWRRPEGPGSGLRRRGDHPVVHVSHDDALAYCRWAGVRLPTEAEWECAARGGLAGQPYPWGAEREPGGEHRMNVWQGAFPDRGTADDGYAGTCPVDAFPPNGFGLYNATGNVWEWCADWFNPRFHRAGPRTDPPGPRFGQSRVLKGGSHLCHDSYCFRYRTSARMGNSPDSSSGNTGFRVAR